MRSRLLRTLLVCVAIAGLLIHRTDTVRAVSSGVVISQVYGGGGNSGSTLKNDFVELYNLGPTAVNVTGWSVQYAATTGSNWNATVLSGVIAPHTYYLVQESAGGGGTVNLPTPNATGTIAMAAGAGKVALLSTNTTITAGTVCPSTNVVDLVGYGTGTNCFEGAGPTGTISATNAAFRKNNGDQDTDNNASDFTVAVASPRNSPLTTNPSGTLSPSAATVVIGDPLTLTVSVTPGTNPASSAIAVKADLTAIGGTAAQAFTDAGGNQFTFSTTIPAGVAGGVKTLKATITDGEQRTATTPTVQVTVQVPTPPTGVGSANPSTAQAGTSTLLTVTTTPGTIPTSTGVGVSADLSSIGGSATQAFAPDGSGGFTFNATIAAGTTSGAKSLPFTVSDLQGRSSTGTIALNVTDASTPPSGAGSANPSSLQAGADTTLTVTATPGANPPSSAITVTADLSAIGGSNAQLFTDGGSNVFTFQTTLANGTPAGVQSLPVTIADGQGRVGHTSITLTVLSPPAPTTVKISQVYAGGGNSGSTYKNDFIELYNQGTSPVSLAGWSVQQTSAGSGTWNKTDICAPGPCTLGPGHYFLVQESAGTSGFVGLPVPDAIGALNLGAASGKVALVANTSALSGTCPSGGGIVDLLGHGSSASCFELHPAPAPGNTTAALRKANGCTDTDDNSTDFVAVTPIPRNSSSPAHVCPDGTQLSALGIASPGGPAPGDVTLLTVRVTTASGAPATGLTVAADLTPIGGSASQPLYDDATNGDQAANDGNYGYLARLPQTGPYGIRSLLASITDGAGQPLLDPITLTVTAPTCGVERWAVKVGNDADASKVDLINVVPTSIGDLRAIPAPPVLNPNSPYDPRFVGFGNAEYTAWVVNATMTAFKREDDVDYHIVIADSSGTMISEIPLPDCVGDASPFKTAITATRATFDSRLTASTFFQNVSLPVQMTGVGFFDFLHGQSGVAPNGIELHPVLDIKFQSATSTAVTSNLNPSAFGQTVDLAAAVSSPGPTPTGQVRFFDGGAILGTVDLDAQAHASFHAGSLAVGDHAITVSYLGDAASAPSRSAALTQSVTRADQTITFDPLPGKTFGDADYTVTATASSGLGVALTVVTGPATLSGNTVHLTGAGTVTLRATQAGDGNYNAADPLERSFDVAMASQTITFATPVPAPRYGAQPFEVTAVGGGSGNAVTFTGSGACTAVGQNGIALVTIVSAGACHLVASQAGSPNYEAAPDTTETITVAQAAAELEVEGVTVEYDGQLHGLVGTATGVKGEDLSALLHLGAKFTNVPGGDTAWTFDGNGNYLSGHGKEDVTITRASPAFSGLSAPTVEAGSASVAIGGTLSHGPLAPTGTVAVTLNGVTMNASIAANGQFSATFAAGSLTVSSSPYAISFAYGGDTNFNSAAGTSSLTVVDTTAPSVGALTATPNVLGPPNHNLIDILVSYTASDVSGAPVCALTVSSNEPLNGTGDGNTSSDWSIIDAHHLQLRAERAGTGGGRIYTIAAACSDAYGHSTSKTTTVSVPK